MIIIISIINVNTKPCVFGAQLWWYQKFLRMSPKKWISSTKTALLDPKRAILWNRGHETACRAAKRPHTGIQSYLRIWGTYDPIESGLSKPRKGGFCGYNVKNLIWGPILAKNVPLHPPQELAQHYGEHENVVFWCSVMMVPKNWRMSTKNWVWAQKQHFWAQKGLF